MLALASLTLAGANPAGASNQLQAVEPKARPLRLEESASVMGTTYTVVLYGSDPTQARSALSTAFDEVRRLDRMLSHYRPDSQVSEINHHAAERPVNVTPELFELLSTCLRFSRESEGTFDVTVGPLMKTWGFFRGTGRLPDRETVTRALDRVGYRNVVLDGGSASVRFVRPGVELDLGGIGKGYAVDRMVAVLRKHGIGAAMVNAGGSSIYGLGAPPGERRGWEVHIRDPKDASAAVAKVYLRDNAISTSGTSEKFFEAEGRTYSHIMDPRTGYPAQGVLEVAIITPMTIDGEAWTKPYFVLGRGWAARHKPNDWKVFMCEDEVDRPCSWVR